MFVTKTKKTPMELPVYILDAVPPVHVVLNHVDTDKLTTAAFTSSWASLSSQSR